MGLTACGIGVGILTFVPLTQYLIAKFGWRRAYFLLAALLVLIVVPLNLFFQRQRPGDMGLAPDFDKTIGPAVPRHKKTNRDNGMSLKQALSAGRFRALTCGALAGAIPLHMVRVESIVGYAIEKDYLPCEIARSWTLLPSLWPPLDVTTTVSPQVQIEFPSADRAEGLKIKTMFSRNATSS